jgi:hypothetical protein
MLNGKWILITREEELIEFHSTPCFLKTIMKCLRGSIASEPAYDDGMMGVNNDSWEDWEEWMGWEGAGTRDYASHINPNF